MPITLQVKNRLFQTPTFRSPWILLSGITNQPSRSSAIAIEKLEKPGLQVRVSGTGQGSLANSLSGSRSCFLALNQANQVYQQQPSRNEEQHSDAIDDEANHYY
jgi:hypothetical protein